MLKTTLKDIFLSVFAYRWIFEVCSKLWLLSTCQLLEMIFEERLTLIVQRTQMSRLKQYVFGCWVLCPSKNQSQQFSGCLLTNRQLSIERIAWDFQKDSVFIKWCTTFHWNDVTFCKENGSFEIAWNKRRKKIRIKKRYRTEISNIFPWGKE